MVFFKGKQQPDNDDQSNAGYRILVLMLSALVVGSAASLTAIGFVDSVQWLNNALLVSPRARVQYEELGWIVPAATVAVPTIGGLIVGLLIARLSPSGRSHGPPDVIYAVQFHKPLPDLRSGLVSTVASGLSIGFGASVGQYGPMVYLGAMFGGLVRRLRLRVPNLPAIAVACGVAAAISTAFNAPIAGLVFAHEVVLRHYSTQAFAPTTVAAAVGYIFANVVFDRQPLFLVNFDGVQHSYEFALIALLGVLTAGLAMLFMNLILRSGRLAGRSHLPPWLRPAAAGLILGVIALALPDILGIGKELLRFATIEGAFSVQELILLVVVKMLVTALCIGFGFAGGVFSPALLIGILFGALFWMVVTMTGLLPVSGVAVYALAGMMAMASPVIGAPLACILIVFELTRNYDITIAAMVAVVFSNLIAHRVFGRSLFDVQLGGRGVDLSDGRDQARLEAIPVRAYVSKDFPQLVTNTRLSEAIRLLQTSDWRAGFVVDAEGIYQGIFYLPDTIQNRSQTVSELITDAGLRFDDRTTVLEAMRELDGFVGDAVPVVEHESGKLLGVVTEASIIQVYLDVSQSLRREENAAL